MAVLFGWELLGSLGAYVGVVVLALALHMFVVYSLVLKFAGNFQGNAFDAMITLTPDGTDKAKVTFDVNGQTSVPDGHGVSNRDRVVVEGVPPAPDPFNGQFVQFDVLEAIATE